MTTLLDGSTFESLLEDVDNSSDSICKSLNFLNPDVWFNDPTTSFHSFIWTGDLIEYENAW